MSSIPVIDIFAGPGGLGEGFSAFRNPRGKYPFGIRLSIEKEPKAHETLELRAFFRQFRSSHVPEKYYEYLRHDLSREALFRSFPRQSEAVRKEAWLKELGPGSAREVRSRIASELGGQDSWVLIGGPPCQAYSLAGRSRNKGTSDKNRFRERQTLFIEYLQILADQAPPIFVMENVKGLLSARLHDRGLFERIRADLTDPKRAVKGLGRAIRKSAPTAKYEIYPVVAPRDSGLFSDQATPEDFVVRAEEYGIPQARHRVILLGIRTDLKKRPRLLEKPGMTVPASLVLDGLPSLRSGLSDAPDSWGEWLGVLREAEKSSWMAWLGENNLAVIASAISEAVTQAARRGSHRGGEFLEETASCLLEPEWFLDPRIGGVLNHSTRGHMRSDLHRYLFASAFALTKGRSPELSNFPPELLPEHANVELAMGGGYFSDRFRVQLADKPSTTITSHISKDGHYYIHPDPAQCRSLTVREAARLQTFPDNYFFCGGRTAQYGQVGNAVPPLLTRKIAAIVYEILR